MNKYYVYVYLHPIKKGNFDFDSYSFQYEPFYVGKGCGNRLNQHIHEATTHKDTNPLKCDIIRDIISEEKYPIIIKIKENLSEDDSLKLEEELIRSIGTIRNKTGSLTNLDDGGKKTNGFKGRLHTSDTKEKIRNKMKGKVTSPIWSKDRKEKLKTSLKEYHKNNPTSVVGKNNGMYGKQHDKETKDKMSENRKGDKNSFYGKKHKEDTLILLSKKAKERGYVGNQNKPFTIDGVEYTSRKDASDKLKINQTTVGYRLLSDNFKNYQFLGDLK